MAKEPPPPPSVPVNVDLIQEPAPPPPADDRAKAEGRVFETARQELLLRDLAFEIDARRVFASRLYQMMVGWLAAMLLVVLADAVTWPWAGQYVQFEVSDTVLITLITTTTATVVGVFLIVAKYLYRTRETSQQ